MTEKFGWCSVGCGSILRRVMQDMDKTNGGYLAAIYARNPEKARDIAEKYGAKVYSSFDEAISHPGVSGVYIATTHDAHVEYTVKALKKGLPVLCEKPFAVNLKQAEQMLAAAKENGVYLAEAMWTRHNPVIRQVIEWVRGGKIGEVRTLTADFAFAAAYNPEGRLFAPEKAGGSLLDIGVYTIAFAQFILDEMPVEIKAAANFVPCGTDGSCAMTLRYQSGAIARLFSSVTVTNPDTAVIYGTKGKIVLPKFWAPDRAEFISYGNANENEACTAGKDGEGFNFEFDAAMEDIRAGRLENPLVSHTFTHRVMEIIDIIKNQIGLRYPNE